MRAMDIFNDTIRIVHQGYYIKDGKRINLKLNCSEMKTVRVFLPKEVHSLSEYKFEKHIFNIGKCGHDCVNMDSFAVARRNYEHPYLISKDDKEILVLNFANPVHPGGGVRNGAKAQEEDLCRTSTLLCSLESPEAEEYYKYNRSLNTYMASDAIMITPKVEIIKDSKGNLLDESVIVSVMSCAAPMVRLGKEGMTEEEYQNMFYNRIVGMLRVAAVMGYRHLVLGAFGCGAFGNDAKVVSDLFYKALKEFRLDQMSEKDCFRRIDFAVLTNPTDQYNYNEFYRNFGDNNFYRDEIKKQYDAVENKKAQQKKYLDKIKGSLIGGAAGDALGYPVEFMDYHQIIETYGDDGITGYKLHDGVAQISDDTQMTLFTANAILVAETRGRMRGIGGNPVSYAPQCYLDWLRTQTERYSTDSSEINECRISWLLDVPELYARRAPGTTCIRSLYEIRTGSCGTIENHINNSKGCGGVMRVAPLGLHYDSKRIEIEKLDMMGAELAAITHGHSLGYMPAAVLTHILSEIVYSNNEPILYDIVVQARNTVKQLFSTDCYTDKLVSLIDLAMELAENNDNDMKNIEKLGEGWVAEETLAIAIYCSLKYQNDFSKGIIAAVNHRGDSDSTGAITGNILGALLGYDRIEIKWKTNLELFNVISEISEDLCYGCHMSEYSDYYDNAWARKYIEIC